MDSVHKKLTQAILRGDSPAKTTAAIEKEFRVSKYKARRLVHTETSYFRARSAMMSYQDLGVEQVEVLETLDSRTCPICGGMDGKVIPLGQVEPGVTVPPYHPNCRGTTVPYFEDMKEGKRAARGADGKTYYVPEGMTYEEWKRGFLEEKSEDGLTEKKSSGKMEKRKTEMLKAIKGTGAVPENAKINIPPKKIDSSVLYFDDRHINGERNHNVNRENTIQWIENAKMSVTVWDGQYERYYSADGAVYVNMEKKEIRTAYSYREYNDRTKVLMEVVSRYED